MYTSIIALSTLLTLSTALPQRNRNGNGNGRAKQQTAQQQAAQVPQGLSQATDGSIIMDDTVMVKYAATTQRSTSSRANATAVDSQSDSRSLLLQTNSLPHLEFLELPQLRRRVLSAPTSFCTAMAASPSSTCPTKTFKPTPWA
jgi:hypothetical protein